RRVRPRASTVSMGTMSTRRPGRPRSSAGLPAQPVFGAARRGRSPLRLTSPPPDQAGDREEEEHVAPPGAEPGNVRLHVGDGLPAGAAAPRRVAARVRLEDLDDAAGRQAVAAALVPVVEPAVLVLEREARRRAALRLEIRDLGALERDQGGVAAV